MFKRKPVCSELSPEEQTTDIPPITGRLRLYISEDISVTAIDLPKGNYVFPFELPLSREIIDTITGGSVHRHFYSDIVASHPVRTHRIPNVLHGNLLDQIVASVEEHTNERLRLRYRTSVTFQILFEASFRPRFDYSSLPMHLFGITPTASDAIKFNSHLPTVLRKEHVIFHHSYEGQKYARASTSELQNLSYTATIPVQLPQGFRACTQDVCRS
ncbi:hypothetical protein BDW72DRAFT_205451 [Aspergillus terricola var. indicus]